MEFENEKVRSAGTGRASDSKQKNSHVKFHSAIMRNRPTRTRKQSIKRNQYACIWWNKWQHVEFVRQHAQHTPARDQCCWCWLSTTCRDTLALEGLPLPLDSWHCKRSPAAMFSALRGDWASIDASPVCPAPSTYGINVMTRVMSGASGKLVCNRDIQTNLSFRSWNDTNNKHRLGNRECPRKQTGAWGTCIPNTIITATRAIDQTQRNRVFE